MDLRLSALEAEMKKQEKGKAWRNALKEREMEREIHNPQQDSSEDQAGDRDRTCRENMKVQDSTQNVPEQNLHGLTTKSCQRTGGNKLTEITNAILEEPTGVFRSSWAQGIQKELERAAKVADIVKSSAPKNDTAVNPDTPEDWEERWTGDLRTGDSIWNLDDRRKKLPPVRRPVQIKDWFGFASSSDESEPDNGDWSAVDRKKKAEIKKLKAAKRKEKMKKESATRASHMVSIGPIAMGSVDYFMEDGENFDNAKNAAIKEFLRYNLNYSTQELDELKIAETRMSTRGDDIVNIALEDDMDVRELYIRKAESRNENLIVRSYIPPNYHERFMTLNKICAEKRSNDPSLKTQLRFGKQDIEVFTKTKGEETGYRKVELDDFTDMSAVPEFNFTIKWRKFTDKPPRRTQKNWEDLGQRPSTIGLYHKTNHVKQTGDPTTGKTANVLTRANSNTTTSRSKKQKRVNADSSEEYEDSTMLSDTDIPLESGTPSTQNHQ